MRFPRENKVHGWGIRQVCSATTRQRHTHHGTHNNRTRNAKKSYMERVVSQLCSVPHYSQLNEEESINKSGSAIEVQPTCIKCSASDHGKMWPWLCVHTIFKLCVVVVHFLQQLLVFLGTCLHLYCYMVASLFIFFSFSGGQQTRKKVWDAQQKPQE